MATLKHAQAWKLLKEPQFTQARVLSLTEPRIDSGLLQNWINRGAFDIDFEQRGRTRYYPGEAVIAICAAQALRSVAVPLEVVNYIYKELSNRALVILCTGEKALSKKLALAISPSEEGFTIQEVSKGECPRTSDAYVILESDAIINRVLNGLRAITGD